MFTVAVWVCLLLFALLYFFHNNKVMVKECYLFASKTTLPVVILWCGLYQLIAVEFACSVPLCMSVLLL